MSNIDPNQLADAVRSALGHTGLPPEQLDQVAGAILAGGDAPDRLYVHVRHAPLPGRKDLDGYRAIYSLGAFPQQPAPAGPGSRWLTVAQIAKRVAEREQLRAEYGDAALSEYAQLKRPVI
jgi:hypothetical protein